MLSALASVRETGESCVKEARTVTGYSTLFYASLACGQVWKSKESCRRKRTSQASGQCCLADVVDLCCRWLLLRMCRNFAAASSPFLSLGVIC